MLIVTTTATVTQGQVLAKGADAEDASVASGVFWLLGIISLQLSL